MRGPRIAAALALLALALPAAASSSLTAARGGTPGVAAPTGLKGFQLRYDEKTKHVFATEPAFAWAPAPNAQRYEFQVARSSVFRDSGIVYENDTLTSPTAAIPTTLPWASGSGTGYGFYARVRAVTDTGTSPWSTTFGFNMRWPNIPAPLTSPDGLIRWTPVVGATGYEIWEKGITGSNALFTYDKWVLTQTNVLDERDWYTFHAVNGDTSWYKTIHWRVRAFRDTSRVPTHNDSPRTFFGPWSPLYTTTNGARPVSATPLRLEDTVSDTIGTPASPAVHGLMPGFAWSGNSGLYNGIAELYRVYVFSDSDCLNPVYVGALTGAPAYAPRVSGTIAFPADQAGIATARTAVLDTGREGSSLTADDEAVVASESLNPNQAKVDPLDPANLKVAAETDPNVPDTQATSTTSGTTTTPTINPSDIGVDSSWVDLWDTDWPSNGYYWTVMPVFVTSANRLTTTLLANAPAGSKTVIVSTNGLAVGDTISVGSGLGTEETVSVSTVNGTTITLSGALKNDHGAGEIVVRNSSLQYNEDELWQDACASGRMSRFGKVSQPVVTGGGKPFVSGLGTTGKLVSGTTTRTYYGTPVITWQPTFGAEEYQIQWSLKEYPFIPMADKLAVGTSSLMSLKGVGFQPGTYYYRVRGIDFELPKAARGMGWSKVQKVTIAPPIFAVSG
jgi:hypothetical protein